MRIIYPRDFIETKERLIFASLSYGDRFPILAFLRYYPNPHGLRIRNGMRYSKVKSTAESFEILRKHYKKYVKKHLCYSLQKIDKEDILRIYYPEDKYSKILKDSNHILHEYMVRIESIFKGIKKGITGSILVDLFDESSDIDLTIYGRKYFNKAREIIKSSDIILSKEHFKTIYKRRKPSIDFETFYKHETRKYNKGIIKDRIFDILLVNMPDELFTEKVKSIKRIGRVVKKLKVIDDTYVFDYPSIYITSGDIRYVICYTHTYVGQAFEGEEIIVAGYLEKVNDSYYRILIGSSREAYGEYIVSKTLLRK